MRTQSSDVEIVRTRPEAGNRFRPKHLRARVRAAWIVALAGDALQIGLLPFVLGGAVSPVNDVVDVFVAAALTFLIGWHWAFLPTFLVELIPVVDLVPSWTLAVFIVTRERR